MFGAAAPAGASGVQPNDPSPYCRPVVSQPFLSIAPSRDGGPGYFKFQTEANVHMSCNGPIYAGHITAIFHYQTKEDSVVVSQGAVAGPIYGCTGSCDADAFYWRNRLLCGEYYDFYDYAQLTGTWQQTAGGPVNNINGTSTTYHGVAHEPIPACNPN